MISYKQYLNEYGIPFGSTGSLPKGKHVFIQGKRLYIHKNMIPLPDFIQKAIVDSNIGDIEYLGHPNKELQEYIIQKRPDLIGKINNLDPELRNRYSHELEIGKTDV